MILPLLFSFSIPLFDSSSSFFIHNPIVSRMYSREWSAVCQVYSNLLFLYLCFLDLSKSALSYTLFVWGGQSVANSLKLAHTANQIQISNSMSFLVTAHEPIFSHFLCHSKRSIQTSFSLSLSPLTATTWASTILSP